MRFRLIILTLLAFANHARAELLTADGVFSIVESDTSYSLSLSTGGSSVASPRVTGNIPVTITFDTETLKASGLTLGDAGVLWWDTFSLRVNSNVRINGVGTLPFTIITEFQNVGTEVFRIGSNVGVNPVTGELNTADFRLITNRGQASVSMEAGGASEFQTGYYSETPEDSPLSKAPVLKIERIRDDIYGFQYDFSLEIEINETVSERIPDTNLTIAASEQAKLLAKFSHEGKTAFGDWYEYNQPLYDSEDLDAKSPTGVPGLRAGT